MKITLDLRLSVEENAQKYYEKAKKSKRKLRGLEQTREQIKGKVEKERKQQATLEVKQVVPKRKMQWFEKFHWCFLSNGMLAVGGRDATTNEMIVKKHTLPRDLLFHTDMAGAPFVVLQTQGEEVSVEVKQEAALLCAVYSRAWQRGLSTVEVFCAKPEQVTKQAQSGEFLPKGAFMVRGKVEYFQPLLQLAMGVVDGAIMAGPLSAVQKKCATYVVVVQGSKKTSDVAKMIAKKLEYTDIDAIVRQLPAGGCSLAK